MPIVCPHCTTSFAVDPASLGPAGRTVRCARCKEVWLARAEDATEVHAPSMATAGAKAGGADDAAAEWEALAREDDQQTPEIESPSIWPAEGESSDADWAAIARDDIGDTEDERPKSRSWFGSRAGSRAPRTPFVSLPTACAAMGALVLALIIWRVDVVRLLPQTATFYKTVGLDVNLRGLSFKDVKITSETVGGKPVLVIEGVIVGEARRPVELPRLRFSVRDAQGAEIYAWNTVLEQPVLKPGEYTLFKSRLASPPPEGRNIDVRFFNKRDAVGGNV
jgi:predicted Zn finger-like uncharacterized protein